MTLGSILGNWLNGRTVQPHRSFVGIKMMPLLGIHTPLGAQLV